jgi:hypothetical protein
MRAAFYLMDDYGPAPTYVVLDGNRYMLVSHAADQMLAAIEGERSKWTHLPLISSVLGTRSKQPA